MAVVGDDLVFLVFDGDGGGVEDEGGAVFGPDGGAACECVYCRIFEEPSCGQGVAVCDEVEGAAADDFFVGVAGEVGSV